MCHARPHGASRLPGGAPKRDFRLLLTGQTLSNLGSALVPIALAFAVLDLTGSATDLGLVLLASRLPNMALVLTGGVVADRFPRLGRDPLPDPGDHGATARDRHGAIVGAPGVAGRAWVRRGVLRPGGDRSAAGDRRSRPPSAGQRAARPVTQRDRHPGPDRGGDPGRDRRRRSRAGRRRGQLRGQRLVARHAPAEPDHLGEQTASFIAQLADGWSAFRARPWLWASVLHVC